MDSASAITSLTQLGILANTARDVIISARQHAHARQSVWGQFPIHCCEYSSWIIGVYLGKHGIKTCVRTGIPKKTSKPTSPVGLHSWLVVNNTFIDITADQFLTTGMGVIVERKIKYYGSSWHNRYFNIQSGDEGKAVENYWLYQQLELDTEDLFLFMRKVYKELCQRMHMLNILEENNRELHHLTWK